jgi:hypothetical protein
MEQSRVVLFFILAAIAIVVVVAGLIIFVLRRIPAYRKYAAAANTASADAQRIKAEYAQAGLHLQSSIWAAPSVSGTLSGTAFRQRIVHGNRNSPPRIELSARSALRGDFSVRREGGRESFFKSIGFAGEAQTGDAAFDREFYLAGTSRDYVQAMFRDAGNREAVRTLFALGFDSVELANGELSAMRRGHAQLLELEALRGALEQLAALRTTPGAMQAAMQGLGGIRTRQIDAVCAVMLGVAIAAFSASVFLLEPMVDGQFAMFLDSWRLALIVCGVLVGATLIVLRGRANAPREFAMIAFLALPSIWITWVSGAMLANQYLDPSPARTVHARLLRHYVTHGKNRSYHLVFASWQRRRAEVNVVVPYQIFNKAQPRQTWIVETRAGRLGYEWIDSLEPLANR